jgi:CheY-like chemotaxis protein
MSELSILLVGKVERGEFRDAPDVLERYGRVVRSDRVDDAVALLAGGQVVADLIAVAQAYPGEFSCESIDRMRRMAPLARVVALLGSWCEGETRTGDPWPAAIRVYWHQWEPRAHQELDRLCRGACSAWSLPVTAGEEERLLLAADEPLARREGLIAIVTADFGMQEWLAAACARRGYATVWLPAGRAVRVEGATAAVFDGDECGDDEAGRLRALAAALGHVPIVALLDFPRLDDCRRARRAGARAVLSKPLSLEDLFWQIDRVTAP